MKRETFFNLSLQILLVTKFLSVKNFKQKSIQLCHVTVPEKEKNNALDHDKVQWSKMLPAARILKIEIESKMFGLNFFKHILFQA